MATTNRDNNNPISPNLAKDIAPNGLDQLWVADTTFTYIAISTGFIHLAVIVDAQSCRVIGFALGCAIEAEVAVAALEVARSRGS